MKSVKQQTLITELKNLQTFKESKVIETWTKNYTRIKIIKYQLLINLHIRVY